MAWWWSYLLATVGITGLALAGSKRRVGWAVGVGQQALWITYAIATAQYGFIIAALGYGAVFARNWWRWRPEGEQEPTSEPQRPAALTGVWRGGVRVDGPPIADSAHLGQPWPRRSTTGREPAGAPVPPPRTRAVPPVPPPRPHQPYRVPGAPRPSNLTWPDDDTDPPAPYDQDREN